MSVKSLKEIGKEVQGIALDKGWYDGGEIPYPTRIALIYEEVSEALRADRKDRRASPEIVTSITEQVLYTQPNAYKAIYEREISGTVQDELADIIMRVAELALVEGIDLDQAVMMKMRYNRLRPRKHGDKKY